MIILEVTAFHTDFSTLEMEKGEKSFLPSGINYTIHPTTFEPILQVEGFVIDENQQIGNSVIVK